MHYSRIALGAMLPMAFAAPLPTAGQPDFVPDFAYLGNDVPGLPATNLPVGIPALPVNIPALPHLPHLPIGGLPGGLPNIPGNIPTIPLPGLPLPDPRYVDPRYHPAPTALDYVKHGGNGGKPYYKEYYGDYDRYYRIARDAPPEPEYPAKVGYPAKVEYPVKPEYPAKVEYPVKPEYPAKVEYPVKPGYEAPKVDYYPEKKVESYGEKKPEYAEAKADYLPEKKVEGYEKKPEYTEKKVENYEEKKPEYPEERPVAILPVVEEPKKEEPPVVLPVADSNVPVVPLPSIPVVPLPEIPLIPGDLAAIATNPAVPLPADLNAPLTTLTPRQLVGISDLLKNIGILNHSLNGFKIPILNGSPIAVDVL